MNQPVQTPVLLATVDSNTTSYTDYEYVVTDGYTNDLVWYDVRAYFNLNQTYSDPSYVAVFANGMIPKIALTPEIPETYSLQTYPNPFNPSTTLAYQMADEAEVSIVIVDVLGREVAILLQGHKSAGYYSTVWNGTDMSGSPVGSGVYYGRFLVMNSVGEVTYAATSRLLLVK